MSGAADGRQKPGAEVLQNWRSYESGGQMGDTLEYPLFSDAGILDEVTSGLGPYQILNAIAGAGFQPHTPSAFVRISHRRDQLPPMTVTDAEKHHGGYLQDEVAALLALELAIRLKSAGATRWFREGGDPKGRPWSFAHFRSRTPNLVKPAFGAVVPRMERVQTISAIPRFRQLLSLEATDSMALVRAARLYQEAIWIAESEPELTWLLLVASAETAAVHWRATKEEPVDRVRLSTPKLAHMLEDAGGPALLVTAAPLIAPYMGATKKFVDFMLNFIPDPPAVRPKGSAQFPWEEKALKAMLLKVYQYRSIALHSGSPFPTPMCMPPHRREGAAEERPWGGAASVMGSVWLAEDTPILLHLFEQMVHGALLRWWDELLVPKATPALGSPSV